MFDDKGNRMTKTQQSKTLRGYHTVEILSYAHGSMYRGFYKGEYHRLEEYEQDVDLCLKELARRIDSLSEEVNRKIEQTESRKQDIETAILRMKDMFALYDRSLQCGDNKRAGKALQETHRAQNALYDAIGGMEDHKFAIRDTEEEK